MYRLERILEACALLLMCSVSACILIGLPVGIYFASVSQQRIINDRCGYDYTALDYFLNGDSISAMCGIEQQQIHLKQGQ